MSESPPSDLHFRTLESGPPPPPPPLWLQYISRGWRIHPVYSIESDGSCSCGKKCDHPGKHPATAHGLKDATTDVDQCRQWFAVGGLDGQLPSRNVSIATGAGSNLIVIDLDNKDGFDGSANFEALAAVSGGYPETLTAITGSGGKHLFFSYPPGVREHVKTSDNVIGKHIDVRADGGYAIVAPSKHFSGGTYQWVDLTVAPAVIPAWLLAACNGRKSKKKTTKAATPPTSSRPFAGVNAAAVPTPPIVTFDAEGAPIFPHGPYGSDGHEWARNPTLFAYGSGLRRYGWELPQLTVELHRCNDTYCVPPLGDDEVDRIAEQAAQYDPEPGISPPPPPGYDESWRDRITFNDKGKKNSTTMNAQITLLNHHQWQGVLGFDERIVAPVFLAPPPFDPSYAGADFLERKYPLRVGPKDLWRFEMWLSATESLTLKETDVKKAVTLVAEQIHINPVRDYLEKVRDTWDGVARIDDWLSDYAGVERTEENSRYGSKWLISACARAMDPGCKVDTILVLQGAQGFQKSTLFAALVPDRSWFTDSIGDLNRQADAALGLAGKWIIEISDGAAFKGRDVDLMKSFITRQVDWFRAPYASNHEEHPRHSVFGMSANPKEIFEDPTGARRFWVVNVGRTMAGPRAAELSAIRDQLWGEAMHRYLIHERWWLTPEEESIARDRQALSTSTDSWIDRIDSWLHTAPQNGAPFREGRRVVVRVSDIMANALRLEVKDQSKAFQIRIRTALDHLGYDKDRVNIPAAEGHGKRGKREIYHTADATPEEKLSGAMAPEQAAWMPTLTTPATKMQPN